MKKLVIPISSAAAAISMSGVANAAVLAPNTFNGLGTGGFCNCWCSSYWYA
jgi:hypothetical protein